MASPESIQKAVEAQEGFINWLVETWRTKNWVRSLLLADVVILIFLNPTVLFPVLKRLSLATPAAWYTPLWVGVIGALFLIALIVAIQTKTRAKSAITTERSAIKGLRPFLFTDSEAFVRLRRNEIIRECGVGITSDDFRFGILCGESGVGKSSLLQAGLWPYLLTQGHRSIYVKFNNLNPVEIIRQAIIDAIPSIGAEQSDTFPELLSKAGKADSTPLVILLDQFEQFFVHNKRKSARKTFIHELAGWYQQKIPSVKILVCLRGDFSDRLIEFQKVMGYSLGPQESFRLDKFDPVQATEILRAIAESEEITFDEDFVREIATVELASREDGLVSPVDIQVLAWMLAGQPEESRAFNRAAYQKLGGVEGLLERFLKRTLDARETESRRQTAIKVLLALTDLERNTRAGAMTIEELKVRLQATVEMAELEEAVEWLARSDIRLITPTQRAEITVYEIAHERLIPALRRIAGQTLSDQDQANQILDRRVNEWLGNNQSRRYLLSWRELLLIKRQRPFLNWGTQKRQKEHLISHSFKRLRIYAVATSVMTLLTITLYSLWISPAGQLWLIKNEVYSAGKASGNASTLENAAAALISINEGNRAYQLVNKMVMLIDRASALSRLAPLHAINGDEARATKALERALKTLDRFPNMEDRENVLRDVTYAYIRVGAITGNKQFLVKATDLLDQINDDRTKAKFLCALAIAYTKLGASEYAQQSMNQALQISHSKSKVDRDYGFEYNTWNDDFTADTLINIADLNNNGQMLTDAISSGQLGGQQFATTLGGQQVAIISDKRFTTCINLAVIYWKVGDNNHAAEWLNNALDADKTLASHDDDVINTIKVRIGLNKKNKAVIPHAMKLVEFMRESKNKVAAFNIIARAYIEIGEKELAGEVLKKAWTEIEKVYDDVEHANAILHVAPIYFELGDKKRAESLLSELDESSTKMPSSAGESIRIRLAASYALIGDWRQARQHIENARLSEDSKLEYLSQILLISKNPAFAEDPNAEDPISLSMGPSYRYHNEYAPDDDEYIPTR